MNPTITAQDLRNAFEARPEGHLGVKVADVAQTFGVTYLVVARLASKECSAGRATLVGLRVDTTVILRRR